MMDIEILKAPPISFQRVIYILEYYVLLLFYNNTCIFYSTEVPVLLLRLTQNTALYSPSLETFVVLVLVPSCIATVLWN